MSLIVISFFCFQSDLKKVLDLIGPAITAIQKMIGDWQAIAGDLGAIKNQVGKANTVPPVILNKSAAQVIDKWNALKTAGESGNQLHMQNRR